jgi:putative salt-induced outer membrane protein
MHKNVMQPHLALLAAAVFVSTAALAEPPKNDGLWRGAGGAALAINSGNTDNSALNMNVDMAATTAADKVSLGGAYNYGKSKVGGVSSTTSDKWNTYGQYDYNLNAKTFVFGKVAFEGDKLSNLDLRATLAGGLGYKVIDTKELSFNLFGGAAYSADQYKLNQTIGSKTSKHFSRSSLFVGEESSHVLSATTTFKQRLEFYPGLSGDKAKIAKFTAGLAVAMSSTLNLTAGLTDSYNSAPPAGNKKNDLGIFTGINVKLGAN